MTRTVHDSFAKEWMKEVLADFGDVEIEAEISGTVRTLDILFRPNAQSMAVVPQPGMPKPLSGKDSRISMELSSTRA